MLKIHKHTRAENDLTSYMALLLRELGYFSSHIFVFVEYILATVS